MNEPFIIPPLYRPPLGLPLRWQDEQSGKLPEAVKTFFECKELDEKQFALLRAYLIHYICAPCWDMSASGDEAGEQALSELRKQANALTCVDEVMPWISKCLEVGIDPL